MKSVVFEAFRYKIFLTLSVFVPTKYGGWLLSFLNLGRMCILF